ncbi:MAG: cytochrome b [Marinobacter sp.]|uniref:cytochrome b n=1 Tax=Marinobacter sp. TaxID=50741 RepID=UPI00299D5A94|nr:cytochrome b [Marinobacter sp.]MDX1635684.1 cytochrome b [Marinobacter sp.]
MQLRNTAGGYGGLMIGLHWLVAIAVFGLFASGWWMVDLSYYSQWYNLAPHLHKSVGLLLIAVMVVRLVWRLVDRKPRALPNHSAVEVVGAKVAHWLLYLGTFVVLASGYLIPTSGGSSIQLFNWFEIPSVTGEVKALELVVGDIHYWSAWALVVLATGHALAGLKHHFIDRDATLSRIVTTRQAREARSR